MNSLRNHLEGRSVLVVDDDEDIVECVAASLESIGGRALRAYSGQEALTKAEGAEPDIAILDYMMPGMNGVELCKALKAQWATMPIAMLTAVTDLDEKVSALSQGADDYITKPFHHRELQARVLALLRVRELLEQLQRAQRTIVEQEKRLVVNHLSGAAAHKIGQPITAILLNCHVLQTLPKEDPRFLRAVTSVEEDARRITRIVESMRDANPNEKSSYYGTTEILNIGDGEKE